jgi:hypothetical protein
MLWRPRSTPLSIPRAAPVPDTQALRQALLQASWQRNRWVARRRIAWRWMLWFGARYLLPALVVIGLGAWLWLVVLPGSALPWTAQPASAPQSLASPPAPTAPAATAMEPDNAATTDHQLPDADPADVLYSPEGEALPVPLALKFDPASPNPAAPRSPPADPGTSARDTPFPDPQLQPENWFHSKEP